MSHGEAPNYTILVDFSFQYRNIGCNNTLKIKLLKMNFAIVGSFSKASDHPERGYGYEFMYVPMCQRMGYMSLCKYNFNSFNII